MKPNPTREGKRRSESFFPTDLLARPKIPGEPPPPLRFPNPHFPVSSTDPQKIPNCRRNPSSGATATSTGGIGGGSFPAPHLGGCAARPVPVASFLRLHLQDFAPLSSEGFAPSSYLCAHVCTPDAIAADLPKRSLVLMQCNSLRDTSSPADRLPISIDSDSFTK
ncbi:hypothetical protein CFC21_066307 [Triticum aestivum]|uniref:Uncharacterized protein n=2 Tax=Triticum aestivum TaxID=4565 RepID=A0A9R1KMC9_WHEAT|nr:hypothetical protein CFC21_066307 [Triticum aestivum]